jgi:hypothetical protein
MQIVKHFADQQYRKIEVGVRFFRRRQLSKGFTSQARMGPKISIRLRQTAAAICA